MTRVHLIKLENEFPASDMKSKTRNVCVEEDNMLINYMLYAISEGHQGNLT